MNTTTVVAISVGAAVAAGLVVFVVMNSKDDGYDKEDYGQWGDKDGMEWGDKDGDYPSGDKLSPEEKQAFMQEQYAEYMDWTEEDWADAADWTEEEWKQAIMDSGMPMPEKPSGDGPSGDYEWAADESWDESPWDEKDGMAMI